MALLLFLLLLGLFLVGVPIAFSLGLASAITGLAWRFNALYANRY